MSRSAERVLPKFFGLYTTHMDRRKRHSISYRALSLCNRRNTVPEKKTRKDLLDFPSSSEKPVVRWGIAQGRVKGTHRQTSFVQDQLVPPTTPSEKYQLVEFFKLEIDISDSR